MAITWYKIAESLSEIHFSKEGLSFVKVKDKTVCLALYQNELRACTNKCPHAGGHLNDGFLDAMGNIVCPLHRYKFNLKNGYNTSGEGYHLKTYAVEIREQGVFIGFPQNKLFGS